MKRTTSTKRPERRRPISNVLAWLLAVIAVEVVALALFAPAQFMMNMYDIGYHMTWVTGFAVLFFGILAVSDFGLSPRQ